MGTDGGGVGANGFPEPHGRVALETLGQSRFRRVGVKSLPGKVDGLLDELRVTKCWGANFGRRLVYLFRR